MINNSLTEEECKQIKRQAVLSLINPPSQETMDVYGSLENYLNPRFVPDCYCKGRNKGKDVNKE